ncbi:hypothetical protein ACFLRI_03395 [Bacteroidota bacterium]
MPQQIKHLVIAFAIVIGLFLVARHFLIPDSFGKTGHYRFDALAENEAHEAKYMGEASCSDCHSDMAELKAEGLHDGLSCEACHGPGYKHIASGMAEDISKPSGREFCGKCHATIVSRSVDNVLQIDITEHNKNKNCVNCHNPHEPWN